MLDHRDRFTSEDGLVNPENGPIVKFEFKRLTLITGIISNSPESGGVDFHEPEVSRNTVTHRDLEDVARDNVNSLDLLHAILVGPDHLAGLRLVFFEGLNGLLGVSFLHR